MYLVRGACLPASLILFLTLSASAQDWEISSVAWGTKPSIELNSSGDPSIAYIYETPSGWVRIADWNAGTLTFDTSDVNLGNFYGPPDLAFDGNDEAGVSHHRHTPVPEQMYGHRSGGIWTNTAIASDNHDGWDNSLAYDSNDMPHTSSIDPTNLNGGAPGVEYAYFDGVNWNVEDIGSGGVEYFSTTSIQLDSNDDPHITYYDNNTGDLMYANKTTGSWVITAVETAGDVGRFSSLRLDASDMPHVAYYEHLVDSSGLVKYASWNGASWDIETVDALDRVYLDLARNTISLDLDSDDTPHISYGDETVVKYATFDGASWVSETLAEYDGATTILGQLTTIAVGDDGSVHISFYEVLTRNPLTGTIMYAVREAGDECDVCDITLFQAKCVEEGGGTWNIKFRLVSLNNVIEGCPDVVFDINGTEYVRPWQTNGTHSRALSQTFGNPSGIYTVSLIAPADCHDPIVLDCSVDGSSSGEWEDLDFGGETPAGMALKSVPARTEILGNYPNPFNPTTTISYALASEGFVSLKIYNTLGQEVATLVNEFRSAGTFTATWDGTNDFGAAVSSGIYLYRLQAGDGVYTQKMMFLR